MSQNIHLSSDLLALGQYLAGEFTNQRQAINQPVWFVHLHLWFRSISLFSEDSVTLFTEQASLVNVDQPYRPRLLRLRQDPSSGKITVQYYKFHDLDAFKGSGRHPEKLHFLTTKDIEELTHVGCSLSVEKIKMSVNSDHFRAFPLSDSPCCFTYQNQTYQIALGFEVNEKEYISHEKGIDSQTGKATWGIMGAYCFEKLASF